MNDEHEQMIADAEVDAMSTMEQALRPFNAKARRRMVEWLWNASVRRAEEAERASPAPAVEGHGGGG